MRTQYVQPMGTRITKLRLKAMLAAMIICSIIFIIGMGLGYYYLP